MNLSASRAYLAQYDFSFLKERFEDEHPEYAGRSAELTEELRKFLWLPCIHDGPLAAMSHGVDGQWHVFQVHTPQYREFCERVYGRSLDHQPRSERFPVPPAAISNFYADAYPKEYGAVPKVWLEDIPEGAIPALLKGGVPEAVLALKWSGWPGWK